MRLASRRIAHKKKRPTTSDMFACAAPLAALARSLLPHSLSPMTTATRCWLPSPQGACHPSPGWMEITISCAYCQTGGAEDMLVNSTKRGAKFCDLVNCFSTNGWPCAVSVTSHMSRFHLARTCTLVSFLTSHLHLQHLLHSTDHLLLPSRTHWPPRADACWTKRSPRRLPDALNAPAALGARTQN